jgi:hypothetical protein
MNSNLLLLVELSYIPWCIRAKYVRIIPALQLTRKLIALRSAEEAAAATAATTVAPVAASATMIDQALRPNIDVAAAQATSFPRITRLNTQSSSKLYQCESWLGWAM